jgi:hypothetical protein
MRWLALTAAIVAGAVDVFYLGDVGGQPGPSTGEVLRVPFVAATIGLAAIAAALATRQSSGAIRPLMLGLSSGGLMAMGFFGIFSIGYPLLLAALLALIALIITAMQARNWGSSLQALAGVVAAIVIVIAGFEIVPHVVSCPPTGTESSSGQGLLGESYSWSCDNGKVTTR